MGKSGYLFNFLIDFKICHDSIHIFYNYPEGDVKIYRDAKCRGIYLELFSGPEGDSCFSIYQIGWIKNDKKYLFVN